MLHKKYFEIVAQFLGDYNRELYGRELIGKVSLSQKSIALSLAELEKEGILTSTKRGSIKFFRLNLQNAEIKDLLMSAESERKLIFFRKHLKIAHIFKNDERVIGIFGSYAKGTQKEDSDIDVFVIGEKIKEDYDKIGKKFDVEISIKYFSEREFNSLIKNENALCKEIIESHILIFGIERFINIVWKEYYAFN